MCLSKQTRKFSPKQLCFPKSKVTRRLSVFHAQGQWFSSENSSKNRLTHGRSPTSRCGPAFPAVPAVACAGVQGVGRMDGKDGSHERCAFSSSFPLIADLL